MSAGSAGLIGAIRADGFSYFEEGGTLIEVHEATATRIDATFDTTYVEPVESRLVFELVDGTEAGDQLLRVTPEDESFFTDTVDHVRCPDVVDTESEPGEAGTGDTEPGESGTDESGTDEAEVDEAAAGDTDESSTSGQTVNQAEAGLLFDVGSVGLYFEADGAQWIGFDRFQSVDGTQGTSWTVEPIYAAATDSGFLNENPQLRNYRLAPGVQFLEIANLDQACDDFDADVTWVAVSQERFAAVDPGLVTLTFDNSGDVVRLRDNRGC
jgi:hypothetical protein